jgi:nicotinamidase-related amidase
LNVAGGCYNESVTVDTEPHWLNSALLTIDMQRDFLTDGRYGIPGTTEVLPALQRLADAFRRAHRPIVHVVQLYLQR